VLLASAGQHGAPLPRRYASFPAGPAAPAGRVPKSGILSAGMGALQWLGRQAGESAAKTAFGEIWKWAAGKVWRWSGGWGAILSGAVWILGQFVKLDRSWVIGSLIGFCFCVFMIVLNVVASSFQRRPASRLSPAESLRPVRPEPTPATAAPPAQPAVSPEVDAPHAALTDEDVADIIRHLPRDQRQLLQQCAEEGVGHDYSGFTAPPLLVNGFIKVIFEQTIFPASTMYKLSPLVEASVKAYFSTVSPPPVEPGFTSDGLDWKPLFGGGVLRIVPTGTGMDLPQPLTLRVQCSTEPKDGWATFYSDTKVGDSNRGYDPVRAEIKGNCAYFVLKAPKLRAPAMLSVSLIGISANEVEDVQRQVAT
jgi:hypothetical protein